MLKLILEAETVTYNGDSEIPEISGYGNTVAISVEGEENCVIKIGDYKFMPHQIEWFLKEINLYKRAVESYHKEA